MAKVIPPDDPPCAYCRKLTPPSRQAARPWYWPGRGIVTNCNDCAGEPEQNDLPAKAYDVFLARLSEIADQYRDYWVTRFRKAGLTFAPDPEDAWRYRVDINGYKVQLGCGPAQAQGVYITVHLPQKPGDQTWVRRYREVKVKSDTGIQKLIRKLHRQEF